jgi:hypothetical protein
MGKVRTKSLLVAVELVVILLVGLAASLALLGTSPLFVVPLGALTVLGIITIVVLPVGACVFGAGAVLITLPALMKLNGVKWWLFTPERLDFCPTVSFPLALGIGLLVISGSLALGYLQALRRELRALERARADGEESRAYAVGQLGATLSGTIASTLASAVVVIVIAAAQRTLTRWLEGLSWVIPVAGVVSMTVLALAIFWTVGSRRDRASARAADKRP